MSSYAATLKPLIRTILETSDLSTISAKGVRKSLISRGHDEATIKANRGEIDEIISGLYDELTAADGASDTSEEKPLVGHTGPATPSSSQQAHGVAPPSSLPRPLAKPKVKRETKTKVEISDSEGEGVNDDEAYARQLQMEYNSYGTRPSRASGSGSGSGRAKKAVVKKKKRSAATVDSGDEDGEPKKKRAAPNTAFNKELILSDTLSALVGEARLSRPQTVKRIWDYVKERDLQDASDKRFIMCDDALRSVFHTDRLHMFTMNKILAKHFMDPADVVMPKDEVGVNLKKDEPEFEVI